MIRNRLLCLLFLLVVSVVPIGLIHIVSNTTEIYAAPPDAYWVNGSGNWSDATNHWATTSNGSANAANLPTSITNVHFDVNSSVGAWTVTVNSTSNCKDMDWTGATNTPTLTLAANVKPYGSVTFISAMVISSSNSALEFNATGGVSLTTGGVSLGCRLGLYGAGGKVTLQDNLTIIYNSAASIYLFKGELDTNNKTVTCTGVTSYGVNAKILTFGSSVINVTSWLISDTAPTLTANTATINVSGNFAGGGITTYHIVNLTGATSTVRGNNSYNQLNLASATTQIITFTDLSTQNVLSASLNGSAGHIHTLKGTDALGWTINKTTVGKVFVDWVALNLSNGTPDNTWYYGYNSSAVNTTGWNQGQFTLTYTNGSNGTIIGSTPQIVWITTDGTAVTAVPNAGFAFTGWSDGSLVNPRTDTNISANVSVTANFAMLPPISLSATITTDTYGDNCLNISWVKAAGNPNTTVVICRDTIHGCVDKNLGNLSTDCMLLYNGSGTTYNSCGWYTDYYEYTITAWATWNGSESATCINLTIGGTEMTDLAYMAIMAFIGVGLFFVSFWQKKLWIFITAGLIWVSFGIFSMNTYAYGEVQWYFGLACAFLAIVLFLAPIWLRARREPAPLEPSRRQLYEERLERELKGVRKDED